MNLDVEAPAAGVLLRILVPDETETAIFSTIGDHRPSRGLTEDTSRVARRHVRRRDGRVRTGEGAARMSLIGIDLGTSAIKVGAYALDGTPLALAHEAVPAYRPEPGHYEVDVIESRAAFRAALAAVAADPAARPVTHPLRSRSAPRVARSSRSRPTGRRSVAAS